MQFSLNNNWIELSPETQAAVDRMGPFSQHALFLLCCQQLYQSQGGTPPDANSPLATDGYTIARNLIDQNDIAKMRAMIDTALDRESPPFKPTSEDPGFNIDWREKDKLDAAKILHKAFSGTVENIIQSYLGSNFLIRTVTSGRLFPSKRQTVSYQWHRDSEVPHQIHVILYLTDLSDSHGTTDILPISETKAIAGAGYDFPGVADRKSDLTAECEKAGCAYAPRRVEAKAGDALIFTPNRVLHRGVQPIEGARDAVLAVALPAPMPWALTLQHNFSRMYLTKHLLNVATDPFAGYFPKWLVNRMPQWVRQFSMLPPDWGPGANL